MPRTSPAAHVASRQLHQSFRSLINDFPLSNTYCPNEQVREVSLQDGGLLKYRW